MERSRKTRAFLLGFLCLVVAYPLATFSLASLVSGVNLFDPAEYRQQRRDYTKAMELCTERRAHGEPDLECPDVNDAAAIQRFLDGKSAAPTHDAAAKKLKESDLTAGQVAVLRRYTRVNTCPEVLKDFLPGFYQLCKSVVGQSGARIKGMANERANEALSNPAPEVTLDDVVKAKTFKKPRSN